MATVEVTEDCYCENCCNQAMYTPPTLPDFMVGRWGKASRYTQTHMVLISWGGQNRWITQHEAEAIVPGSTKHVLYRLH